LPRTAPPGTPAHWTRGPRPGGAAPPPRDIRHDVTVASNPSVAVARPSPTGHAASITAMAVAISRPENQSAVIFTRRMFMSTAPAPLNHRSPAAPANPALHAVRRPPATLTAESP